MIQRGIGVALGAVVTLILLLLIGPTGPEVAAGDYIAPLVIGAIAAFFWPIVIGFWLGRRAKARSQARIEDEVQRQLDQQG